jgi:hypothetical protein
MKEIDVSEERELVELISSLPRGVLRDFGIHAFLVVVSMKDATGIKKQPP